MLRQTPPPYSMSGSHTPRLVGRAVCHETICIKGEGRWVLTGGGSPPAPGVPVSRHLPHMLSCSALVSKAWETLSSKDDLWHPFLSKTDPMSALGEERLRVMSLQYSCKQVRHFCATHSSWTPADHPSEYYFFSPVIGERGYIGFI